MNGFYIFLVTSSIPLLYKFNKIIQKEKDPIIVRFSEPNSYLNNLISYEYFNSMTNYYKSIINNNINHK